MSRPFWRDADGDSYGAGEPKQARTAGELGDGWVTNSTDCNDTNARLFQIATNVGRDMDGDRWLLSGPQSACVGDGPIDVLDLVVFLDENGGGTWLLASTTLGVGDCDDSDQAVHPATAFVPDCDLDQLADDEETVTGCPGTLETVLFHCPNGGTCARRVFVDRGGNFPVYYIPIAQAKHDERGVLLRDPVPGCSSR